MECPPTPSALVEKAACAEPFSEAVPMVVAPSLKVTVPVGVAPLAETVAVNVTTAPNAAGLADEPSATLLDACVTVIVRIGEMQAR